MTLVVHPDLLGFDLRRPYREWPESVRTLIEERQREAGNRLVQGPRCECCGNLCVDLAKDESGNCPDCSELVRATGGAP